jgi:hypothetical protein
MDTFEASFLFFLIRLIIGGIAGFFAIFYLSKTRELAWIFIIVGTLSLYVYILFDTMHSLQIISFDFPLFGVSFFTIFSIILSNLPLIFIALGFISVLLKHR